MEGRYGDYVNCAMYKVVWRNEGTLRSHILSLASTRELSWTWFRCVGNIAVEYKPDEWVSASVGGLLVFDDLDRAKEFAERWSDLEIWLCEARNEVRLPKVKIVSMYIGHHENDVKLLWEGHIDPVWDVQPWPKGTRAFKEVKLVKRINSNQNP